MILGYILLNLMLLAVLLWARTVLGRFLRMYRAIDTNSALSEFKSVARWNMYGALGFLICGGVGMIWAVILGQQHGLKGLLIVLSISIPSLLLSLSMKKLEVQSRSLPADDALKSEYQRISETWVKKALPDF